MFPDKRIKAPGNAKYRGDLSHTIVGKVLGPTTFHTFLTAVEASYDADADQTTVWFSQSTVPDLEAAEPGFAEYRSAA